jgi:hypothetical protein
MTWYLSAIVAHELIREREREIAALLRERDIRSTRTVRTDLPRFGRIRRPLARLAAVIGSAAGRAAAALDSQVSRS